MISSMFIGIIHGEREAESALYVVTESTTKGMTGRAERMVDLYFFCDAI